MRPPIHTILLASNVALILLPGAFFGLMRNGILDPLLGFQFVNPVFVFGFLIGYPTLFVSILI